MYVLISLNESLRNIHEFFSFFPFFTVLDENILFFTFSFYLYANSSHIKKVQRQ